MADDRILISVTELYLSNMAASHCVTEKLASQSLSVLSRCLHPCVICIIIPKGIEGVLEKYIVQSSANTINDNKLTLTFWLITLQVINTFLL